MNKFRSIFCVLLAILLGWSEPSFVTAMEQADDWTALVRGSSFDGWYILIEGQAKHIDDNHVFHVKDGVIHAFRDTPAGQAIPFGGIVTEKEYSRFHLRLEYKWGSKKFAPRQSMPRDGGIIYHVQAPDHIWPQGVECQIQEGDTGDIYAIRSAVTTTINAKTKDAVDPVTQIRSPCFLEAAEGGASVVANSHGRICDVARVRRNRNREHEGWNRVDVIVDGDRAVHLVNGKVNNRCTNMSRPDPNDPQRMIPLTQGKIMLQAEGAEVLYRNIAVKDLSESDHLILDSKP